MIKPPGSIFVLFLLCACIYKFVSTKANSVVVVLVDAAQRFFWKLFALFLFVRCLRNLSFLCSVPPNRFDSHPNTKLKQC